MTPAAKLPEGSRLGEVHLAVTDEAAFGRFFHAMLGEGVAMAPGAYEAIFVGMSHTDAVLDRVAAAAHRAAAAATP